MWPLRNVGPQADDVFTDRRLGQPVAHRRPRTGRDRRGASGQGLDLRRRAAIRGGALEAHRRAALDARSAGLRVLASGLGAWSVHGPGSGRGPWSIVTPHSLVRPDSWSGRVYFLAFKLLVHSRERVSIRRSASVAGCEIAVRSRGRPNTTSCIQGRLAAERPNQQSSAVGAVQHHRGISATPRQRNSAVSALFVCVERRAESWILCRRRTPIRTKARRTQELIALNTASHDCAPMAGHVEDFVRSEASDAED